MFAVVKVLFTIELVTISSNLLKKENTSCCSHLADRSESCNCRSWRLDGSIGIFELSVQFWVPNRCQPLWNQFGKRNLSAYKRTWYNIYGETKATGIHTLQKNIWQSGNNNNRKTQTFTYEHHWCYQDISLNKKYTVKLQQMFSH